LVGQFGGTCRTEWIFRRGDGDKKARSKIIDEFLADQEECGGSPVLARSGRKQMAGAAWPTPP
jgi:hypothetical protein